MNKTVLVRGHAPEAVGALAQADPFSAVRLPVDLTAEIDAWGNHYEISRSEAIRRLVEIGLRAEK